MKILLVYPLSEQPKKDRYTAIFPPLSLAYLAAVLEKEGHDVKIIDGFVLSIKRGYTYYDLEKDIKKFNPNIVGVSCLTGYIPNATKVLDIAKRVNPKIITLIGGPHITAVSKDLLKFKSADFGVYGEAELTLKEFVNKLKSKKSIKNIKGIIYKNKNKIKFKIREYIGDIDTLPPPARHLLPMNLYQPSPTSYRQLPATVIITSRGCPYQCIFCNKHIFGSKFRKHSTKRVIDEIVYLNKVYNIKELRIYDDTFTLDKKRAVEICNKLIKLNLGITWSCATRIDTVDYELLKLMKGAGCYNISFGIESGSKRILKLIKKGITKEQTRKVIKMAKQLGIETIGFFMLGLPTQTKQEMCETIKFAKEINPDFVQFTLVYPMPDTELWDLCKKTGKIQINDWHNFKTYSSLKENLPYTPNTVSEAELKKIYKQAYKKFYFRPAYILNKLSLLFRNPLYYKKLFRGIKVIFNRFK